MFALRPPLTQQSRPLYDYVKFIGAQTHTLSCPQPSPPITQSPFQRLKSDHSSRDTFRLGNRPATRMIATPLSFTRRPSALRPMNSFSSRARSSMRRQRASTCMWPLEPARLHTTPKVCCTQHPSELSIGKTLQVSTARPLDATRNQKCDPSSAITQTAGRVDALRQVPRSSSAVA